VKRMHSTSTARIRSSFIRILLPVRGFRFQALVVVTPCLRLRQLISVPHEEFAEPARSGGLRKNVLVLAIADDQYPLAAAFTHHKFEP